MVPKAKAESHVKTPSPETQPVTKRAADIKKPLVKKRPSIKASVKKPQRIRPEANLAVSGKKPDAKGVITLRGETSKTVLAKKPKRGGSRPEPVVSEKKPEARSLSPAKEDIAKRPIEKKPETISMKSKAPAIARKPQPGSVTSIPERVPASRYAAVPKAPSSPKQTLSHPYSLYLGSFRTLERAKTAISLYSKKGLSPYCSRVDFNEKGIWFRVFAGHFQDREKAEKFKEIHRLKEGTVKKTTFANLIGTYKHPRELENRQLSLRRLGYFPYVIRGGNGESRLYVGAFITKEGAEQQYHDLKSSGIQSQIVKR
jgi:cell division septation protein DedD